jgi:hypothetical protein
MSKPKPPHTPPSHIKPVPNEYPGLTMQMLARHQRNVDTAIKNGVITHEDCANLFNQFHHLVSPSFDFSSSTPTQFEDFVRYCLYRYLPPYFAGYTIERLILELNHVFGVRLDGGDKRKRAICLANVLVMYMGMGTIDKQALITYAQLLHLKTIQGHPVKSTDDETSIALTIANYLYADLPLLYSCRPIWTDDVVRLIKDRTLKIRSKQ